MSHSEAFEFFGVVPKNIRWSWSGRSPDGQTVAVRLWQDRFENGGRCYRSWSDDKPGEWKSRPGFTELIDNLAYARVGDLEMANGSVELVRWTPNSADVESQSSGLNEEHRSMKDNKQLISGALARSQVTETASKNIGR